MAGVALDGLSAAGNSHFHFLHQLNS